MAAAAWDALYRRGEPYHGAAPLPFFAPSLPAGALVLDLGCGAGKSLRALAEAGRWRVLGLDASAAALRLARARAPVARADAAALPLRDASVDAAVAHHLLGHLDAPARAACAAELARVLKPGAPLDVREFAEGDLREGRGERVAERTWARGGVATRYFARGELGALLGGFEGGERVEERRVRFAQQPRRVVHLALVRARDRAKESPS